MTTRRELERDARRLAATLAERGVRVVFAESCTAGLVSAMLAGVPGVSEHLCGSAVVYRLDTKARWLGVPRELLDNPGPVSAEVASAMARGALERTPEAHVAASITGHLGPHAPPELDGLVFCAAAVRNAESPDAPPRIIVREHRLSAEGAREGVALRLERQRAAAAIVLRLVAEVIS